MTAALWATGALVGILMVVPVAMLLAGRLPATHRASGEVAVILGAVVLVSVAAFALRDHQLAAALQYTVLLPVVWAALRLRLPGTAIAIAVATNVALLGTTFGRGPFAGAEWTSIGSASLLRVFLVVITVTALLIASRAQEGASSAGLAAEREQLLAAVSHELRTPLTPIVGFSQLLLERRVDLDPQARAWIGAIDRNGRHLIGLIDDLLLLSRASRDRLVTMAEPVALGTLVAQVVEDRQQPGITAGRIDRALMAWAEPQQVRQILDNLLQNALRHGRPPVVVTVDEVDGQARLVVTDGGDGVPEELVSQLFAPFSQPEVGDRRGIQGLGLGLAICAQLATSNGGTIAYEPDASAGARFVVRLPLADREPEASAPSAMARGAADPAGADPLRRSWPRDLRP